MPDLVITGTVHKVENTQQITDKFKKRELIVNTGGDYPQMLKCEFHNDDVDLLNELVKGMEIETHLNVRGREWIDPKTNTPKYFVSLKAWKLVNIGMDYQKPELNAPASNVVPEMNGEQENAFNEAQQSAVDQDDLPF